MWTEKAGGQHAPRAAVASSFQINVLGLEIGQGVGVVLAENMADGLYS